MKRESLTERIVERIRAILQDRHWSANELERRAGLSNGYLSQVLTAKRTPTLALLAKLEQAAGRPILAIAGRSSNRKPKAQDRTIDKWSDREDSFDQLLSEL